MTNRSPAPHAHRLGLFVLAFLFMGLVGQSLPARADKFFLGAGIYASGDSEALKQCEEDRCRLEKEITGLNDQIAQKRRQIGALYRDIDEWRTAYGKLKEKNVKLEAELKTAQDELAKCESEKTKLEKQLKTAESDLAACQLVKVRLQEKLHFTEDKLNERSDQLKVAAGQIKEKTGELKKKTEKVSDLRADLARKDTANRWSTWLIVALAIAAFLLLCAVVISAIRYAGRLRHNEDDLRECRQKGLNDAADIATDKAKILALTERVSKAETEAKEREREIEDLNKRLNREDETVRRLQHELEEARRLHIRDDERIGVLGSRADKGETNANQLLGQVERLSRENMQLASWLNECKTGKAAAEKEAAVAMTYANGTTRELAAIKCGCGCGPAPAAPVFNNADKTIPYGAHTPHLTTDTSSPVTVAPVTPTTPSSTPVAAPAPGGTGGTSGAGGVGGVAGAPGGVTAAPGGVSSAPGGVSGAPGGVAAAPGSPGGVSSPGNPGNGGGGGGGSDIFGTIIKGIGSIFGF